MKSNDIIRPFEKSLFIQFGRTGELQSMSTLRIDQGITLSRNGNSIEARYHNGTGAPFVVERFSSESLANTAFQHLQATVKRYSRYRHFTALWKGGIKWGFAPLVLAMLALAVNMVATRAAVDNTAATVEAPGGAPMGRLPTSLNTSIQPSTPASRPAAASSDQLAKAMADGVRSGKYSVLLSKGSKGTLYIFSDPSCPHCQDLKPELDKLSKDYTIHIFPVTVIGGEMSSHRVAKLLCEKPDARAALWKKITGGDDTHGSAWLPSKCTNGDAAVAANNQIFRAMRFVGTPTIINAAGEQIPDTIPNTADAINQWMKSSASTRK